MILNQIICSILCYVFDPCFYWSRASILFLRFAPVLLFESCYYLIPNVCTSASIWAVLQFEIVLLIQILRCVFLFKMVRNLPELKSHAGEVHPSKEFWLVFTFEKFVVRISGEYLEKFWSFSFKVLGIFLTYF